MHPDSNASSACSSTFSAISAPRGNGRYNTSGSSYTVQITDSSDPDTGQTGQRYDSAGNLAARTDARNQRGIYAYDALDRIAQIQYGTASPTDPAALASVEETLGFLYDDPLIGGEGAKGRLCQTTPRFTH
ncbi:MAG: hypothetical protein KDE20_22290 [Caldilineaceae bacterium]|nr:hypothetical protein [Caldilineaceae bacterium]